MADIDTYLSNILSAVYGEQVRGSIHDAIEAINTVVSNWEAGLMDTTLTSTSLPAQGKAVGDAIAALETKTLTHKGQLTASDDIDTYASPGQWYAGTNSPVNWPEEFSGKYGRLIVLGSLSDNLYSKVQIVISQNKKIAIRMGVSSTAWSAFTIFEDKTSAINALNDTISALEEQSLVNRGQIPQADDIDDYIAPGQWYASGNTPENWPFPGKLGRLLVLGSTSNTKYTKVQIVISSEKKIAIRVGVSAGSWSNFTIYGDVDTEEAIAELTNAVRALSKTDKYSPVYQWEQGSFTTSSWTKGSSSASNYSKYIRFVDYPSLAGVAAIRVTIPDGYTAYIGCYGWSSAVSSGASLTVRLTDTDKTMLNISLYHGGATITPSDGDNISVEFIPSTSEINERIDGIKKESDGIIIRSSSSPIKVGLYGASIVAGYGVSDYSSHLDGGVIDLNSIGYDKTQSRYTGDKTWGNMLKSYLETYFPNVAVTNWAISGATATSYYNYLKKSQANNNSPIDTDVDIAIIMMGNNGRTTSMANNINSFKNIIDVFKDSGAEVFFLTPTAAFNTSESFVINTYQIMHCAKAAAKDAGICAVDAFAWIEEYCSENGISLAYDATADKNFLNSDNLHPNDLGHQIIYKAIKYLLKV